jgi:hypothetical protein
MMTASNMLIYAVSLKFQLAACITIHNRCSNTKLASPIYFGSGAVCSRLSNQQIDIGTKMKASFEINPTQYDFEVILLSRLKIYSNGQHNMDTLTTKTKKKEAECVQMLAAWKVNDFKPLVYVVLVEHTKKLTWNEDKLKKLYDKNCGWLKEYDSATSYTWFIDDDMTLRTTVKVRNLKRILELDIYISEKKRDDYAMRPLSINLKR